MCGRASLEVARTWPLRESTLGSTFYSLCGVENATWICRGLTPVLDLGPRIQVSCSTTPPPPTPPNPTAPLIVVNCTPPVVWLPRLIEPIRLPASWHRADRPFRHVSDLMEGSVAWIRALESHCPSLLPLQIQLGFSALGRSPSNIRPGFDVRGNKTGRTTMAEEIETRLFIDGKVRTRIIDGLKRVRLLLRSSFQHRTAELSRSSLHTRENQLQRFRKRLSTM